MSPHHSSGTRDQADPLSPFVQLVVPSARDGGELCAREDTLARETGPLVSVSAALYVESLDDTLAAEYPLLDSRSWRDQRDALSPFVSSIRERIERQVALSDDGIFSEHRAVSIRYGRARVSDHGRSLVWVECRCDDTEAYLLPRVDAGVLSSGWSYLNEASPERFHDGPARLLLELDPNTSEILDCKPLISPQCSAEAQGNFLAALRSSELGRSSYLLSQYYGALVHQAIELGVLPANPSKDERREFLRAFVGPMVLSVSTSSDRVTDVVVRHQGSEDSGECVERITLREISPWGLSVTGVTRVAEQVVP